MRVSSERRNNAVHSPYFYSPEGQEMKMVAADFFGHPRAKKLTGKGLLGEFRWYWKFAQILAAYAISAGIRTWFREARRRKSTSTMQRHNRMPFARPSAPTRRRSRHCR